MTAKNTPQNPDPEKKKDTEQTAAEMETTPSPPEAEAAGTDPSPDYQALYEQMKGAAEELADMKDKYLRLLAEYDNYRKRSQKDRESTYSDAKTDTISALLPVYDNLERALLQHTDDEAYYKGIEMTMAQFENILSQMNVEKFGAPGDVFDPTLHSGVMHVEDESAGENVITEVFQKGFRLGDKIIRFAMVKVAN